MGKRTKFGNWVHDVGYYETTPIEYVDSAKFLLGQGSTSYSGFAYNNTGLLSTINLVNLVGKEITFRIFNQNVGTAYTYTISYNGETIGTASIGSNESSVETTIVIPDILTEGESSTLEIVNNYNHTMTCTDSRVWHYWKLTDIISDSLVDSDIADFFNEYYKCWCIVPSCYDSFADTLLNQYNLVKNKLALYKTQLTGFTGKGQTIMSVQYGERNGTENGYEYPISGNISTSTPNTGVKTQQLTVTDTTTVTKDEEPFKHLERIKAMDDFNKFFVDCFRDCFTLNCAMTW